MCLCIVCVVRTRVFSCLCVCVIFCMFICGCVHLCVCIIGVCILCFFKKAVGSRTKLSLLTYFDTGGLRGQVPKFCIIFSHSIILFHHLTAHTTMPRTPRNLSVSSSQMHGGDIWTFLILSFVEWMYPRMGCSLVSTAPHTCYRTVHFFYKNLPPLSRESWEGSNYIKKWMV